MRAYMYLQVFPMSLVKVRTTVLDLGIYFAILVFIM
jgi:hypothetical protein